ncbi:MAG: spore coat U domain-containing protein [Steroidobacteraceae bacterium]
MTHRHTRLCLVQIGILTLCGLLCAPARGASITGSCTASATGVSFGTYNLLSATPLESTGTVTVNCSAATVKGTNSVTVSLSAGQSGSFTARRLGTGFTYNLYQNAAFTEIWGDGTGNSTLYTGSITKKLPSFTATVYGQIPALQNPAPGSFTDTITVTVDY